MAEREPRGEVHPDVPGEPIPNDPPIEEDGEWNVVHGPRKEFGPVGGLMIKQNTPFYDTPITAYSQLKNLNVRLTMDHFLTPPNPHVAWGDIIEYISISDSVYFLGSETPIAGWYPTVKPITIGDYKCNYFLPVTSAYCGDMSNFLDLPYYITPDDFIKQHNSETYHSNPDSNLYMTSYRPSGTFYTVYIYAVSEGTFNPPPLPHDWRYPTLPPLIIPSMPSRLFRTVISIDDAYIRWLFTSVPYVLENCDYELHFISASTQVLMTNHGYAVKNSAGSSKTKCIYGYVRSPLGPFYFSIASYPSEQNDHYYLCVGYKGDISELPFHELISAIIPYHYAPTIVLNEDAEFPFIHPGSLAIRPKIKDLVWLGHAKR